MVFHRSVDGFSRKTSYTYGAYLTTEYIKQGNSHGLSTQEGATPLPLWHPGVINNVGIHPIINDIRDDDEDGPLPELHTNNNVRH